MLFNYYEIDLKFFSYHNLEEILFNSMPLFSFLNFKCIDILFEGGDYHKKKINEVLLNKHNQRENAWIAIDKIVYSIQKNDVFLLDIFKNCYGKDVKSWMEKNITQNLQEEIINRLSTRKIGVLEK